MAHDKGRVIPAFGSVARVLDIDAYGASTHGHVTGEFTATLAAK